MDTPIRFTLNGEPTEAHCRADMTVLEWLRLERVLRGSKEGCAEGDCGACSVLARRPDGDGEGTFQAANACIMLMGQLEGASLVTVEGLAALDGKSKGSGHPVQERMAENGSSQCGFCTPGIVAALAGLLDRNGAPKDDDIHDALAGNLCRCTGYRPVVDAAKAAARDLLDGGGTGLPEAKRAGSARALPAAVGAEGSNFHLPRSLDELLALRAAHPDAILLGGGTDLALDVAHARARWPEAILTRKVAELRYIEITDTHLVLGGAVTWEEVLPHLEAHWPSFATLVRRFGSVQIRSMGTVAGNLATASPIGDGAPALLALGAYLTLAAKNGERELALDDFFTGYRQSALREGEIIRSIHIPLPRGDRERFRVYKLSKRYDQDISTVCAAFALRMDGDTVADARIAFGGMAATPTRCVAAEEALNGQSLDDDAVAAAREAIAQTFTPMDDMRGTAAYRARAAGNLVERLRRDLAGETVEVMAL